MPIFGEAGLIALKECVAEGSVRHRTSVDDENLVSAVGAGELRAADAALYVHMRVWLGEEDQILNDILCP